MTVRIGRIRCAADRRSRRVADRDRPGCGGPVRARAGWYACGIALVAACAPADPNAGIEALVARAEAAVEARDTGFFRGVIAPSYADAAGRDRDELIRLLRGWFLTTSDIEVVSRIAAVELDGDAAARVRVDAGILTRGGRSLLDLDGELRSLELELVRDSGQWRVIGADWGEPRD